MAEARAPSSEGAQAVNTQRSRGLTIVELTIHAEVTGLGSWR